MNTRLKHILRSLKWPLFLLAIVLGFIWGFVPLAKWLFVGKTLEAYNEVSENYSKDPDKVTYEGFITDTVMRPSNEKNGKTDTLVHQQTIRLEPQNIPSDNKPKIEDVGTFGDGAGLLNAFFSFLAFMAVLLTIYLQSRKDGHDKQNGARVLFEQEFFAMVGMLENIVSHLRFSDKLNAKMTKEMSEVVNQVLGQYYKTVGMTVPQKEDEEEPELIVVEGRDVFCYLYADREHYSLRSIVGKSQDLRETTEAQENCFDGTLDHYFRYLYRILKHIDESELLGRLDNPKKERTYYAHLLRAQLSNYELLMLFYNGLLGENPNTIKKLIEKYAMFNNLRAWELGTYQKEYYQSILDEERYENPKGYDEQTTYSVTAFWDEEKLEEIRQRCLSENKESWPCVKCYRRVKGCLAQKWQVMKAWCEEKPSEVEDKTEVTEEKSEEEKPEQKKSARKEVQREAQPWERKEQREKKRPKPENLKEVKKQSKKGKKKK